MIAKTSPKGSKNTHKTGKMPCLPNFSKHGISREPQNAAVATQRAHQSTN
jgi:hypothetical protein